MGQVTNDGLSLADGFELVRDGYFDTQVNNMPFRKRRQVRRIKRRLNRETTAQAFYDEIIPEIRADAKLCAAAPVLSAADEIEPETPLGFDADGFFELFDMLLERMPAIIDAVLRIISLFVALIVCGAALVSAGNQQATAQTPAAFASFERPTAEPQTLDVIAALRVADPVPSQRPRDAVGQALRALDQNEPTPAPGATVAPVIDRAGPGVSVLVADRCPGGVCTPPPSVMPSVCPGGVCRPCNPSTKQNPAPCNPCAGLACRNGCASGGNPGRSTRRVRAPRCRFGPAANGGVLRGSLRRVFLILRRR